MAMDPAVWDVLHDGVIVGISGNVPGDLQLQIDIAYLCEHLRTDGTQLCITLLNCKLFEYHSFEDPATQDRSRIVDLALQVLSAESSVGNLTVEIADGGSGGRLRMFYDSVSVKTIEGVTLTLHELQSAAERYWVQWSQKHQAQ